MVFGFLRGGKVNLSVEVGHPTAPYYPDAPIHARVTVQNEKEMNVQEGRVALLCHEHYQYRYESYDDDGGTTTGAAWADDEWEAVREIIIPEGTIPGNFLQTYEFDWQLPADATPTYRGKITQVRWLVKATLARKLGRDVNAEAEFQLFSSPPEERVEPGDYGECNHPDEVDMALWLPRLKWVEGETIEGKLIVQPRKDFGVNEVRVELVRQEHVPRDEGNRHMEVADKKQLAQKSEFRTENQAEYLFALTIPAKNCPSIHTPNSIVTWQLKGVLSRRLRTDHLVECEIKLFTGAPPVWR